MTQNAQFAPVFFRLEDIAGLKVTIMGLGLNGGGLASAHFFARYGAEVTITDMKGETELAASVQKLETNPRLKGCSVRYVLGRHELSDFKNADVVIKNPGVRLEGNKFLEAAASIETDISVFLRFTQAPILAVTGSKGKSSTASALYYGLKEAGFTAFLGGNITVSPLTFLEKTAKDTPVVLELSSWQLGDLKGRGILKPKIAIITLIVPDHQNWYGNMESYVADKKLIYADQDAGCFTLCNHDDGWGEVFASETKARVLRYSRKPLPDGLGGAWLAEDGSGVMRIPGDIPAQNAYVGEGRRHSFETAADGSTAEYSVLPSALAIPGFHMKENILNAAQALVLMGTAPQKAAAILACFPGIEHRLEYFYMADNTAFYNDSAATVPEAAAAALQSFEKPVYFICGGTDKNLDFTILANTIRKAEKIFLLAGSGTDKLLPLIRERGISFYGPFDTLDSLLDCLKAELPQTAVLTAGKQNPQEASAVAVFSPGATSFGMFANEFDRGTRFKKTVRRIFG